MRRLFPFFILLIFTLLVFHKTVIFGLVPVPFDLLVSWFFPYLEGGWGGIWILHKGGHFAADAIRQLYPWRELAIDLIKHSQLPLWNPYAFSGTPLLANFQTAIFYPLNIIFFLVPSFPISWTIYLASSVFLGALWMYLLMRLLGRSCASALIAAIAFSASGYMIVWLEWGVIVHALIWLPCSLFAVTKWFTEKKKRYLAMLVFSVSTTILAGYAQGAAYNLLVIIVWSLFFLKSKSVSQRRGFGLPLIIAALLTIGITAIQWLPTLELYRHSAMKGEVSQHLAEKGVFPFFQLATLLVPDYFGNRVTENYWGKEVGNLDYMDADIYVGVVTLLLALLAVLSGGIAKEQKRWFTLLGIGLLMGLDTPIPKIIARLGIPVVSTGVAAETLVISMFALCALAALGLDLWEKQGWRVKMTTIITVAGLYLGLFLVTFRFNPDRARIAREALVVPMLALMTASTVLLFPSRKIWWRNIKATFLIGILIAELLFHANKILPFASANFAFPKHILIEELQKRAGFDRVDGFWESEIATNFHTAFRLFSAEGYDPLYIRCYGELVTASETGTLPPLIPRSDADITQTNETNRNRLTDLTSVKFIAAKVTDPNQVWEEEPLKYDPSRFKLVWQKEKFKIYENLHALPRAKLFYDWQIVSDDGEIIKTLYDQNFDLHKQIILERDPGIARTVIAEQDQSLDEESTLLISNYRPTHVEIQSKSSVPAILLLTDSYYPGWRATIDGIPTEILRANYTFRAVVIPPGIRQVSFRYAPTSFNIGAVISGTSLIALATYFATSFQKAKKRS